jgi:hypothetical protein
MLCSHMFGSRSPLLSIQPPFFSANSAPSSLKCAPKRTTQRCTSPTVQLLTSFSTPNKHRAQSTTHDSLPFCALLRASPDTPSEVLLPVHALINPLETILTKFPVNVDSKQLTKTLNPLNATFTKIAGGYLASRQRYPLWPRTIHYSLLTGSINPLHYAFEAHHDS